MCNSSLCENTHTHTHTTVLLLCWNLSGTTRVSRYQKGKTRQVKTNLDLLEQEIVSGSGICWAICKSAPHPRQPRQHPTTQFFYRPDALPAAQFTMWKIQKNKTVPNWLVQTDNRAVLITAKLTVTWITSELGPAEVGVVGDVTVLGFCTYTATK